MQKADQLVTRHSNPLKDLAAAVITQALLDATEPKPVTRPASDVKATPREMQAARLFISKRLHNFDFWCELWGHDPEYIQRKCLKEIGNPGAIHELRGSRRFLLCVKQQVEVCEAVNG